MQTESYANGKINAQTKGPSKSSTIEASQPLPRTNPARAAGRKIGSMTNSTVRNIRQRKRSSFTTFVFRGSSTSEQTRNVYHCTSSPFRTPHPRLRRPSLPLSKTYVNRIYNSNAPMGLQSILITQDDNCMPLPLKPILGTMEAIMNEMGKLGKTDASMTGRVAEEQSSP
jgi:hypothetical protein